MHLLFADSVADRTIAELESRGHRCSVEPALTTAELPGRIAGVDGLVVRSTKVDRAVFEAADKLALVIRAGAGTNTIDTEAAARHGVLVSNVPGRNAAAVAELAGSHSRNRGRSKAAGRDSLRAHTAASTCTGAMPVSSLVSRSAAAIRSASPASSCSSPPTGRSRAAP